MPKPWMENDNGDVDGDGDIGEDDVEQDGFCIGDDPSAVLDQYLVREELEELILEKGNVFNNDLS